MRRFASSAEVYAAQLPDWQHLAVAEAVRIMEGIFGEGFDSARGCVVLIEKDDVPEDAEAILGCHLGSKMETTCRRHDCLVGLTILGNSGDGITWVCPELENYAPAVQMLLRAEL